MVNAVLTYAIMLDLLIVVYVQFVIMLIETQKVLSVKIALNANNLQQKVYVAKLPQSCQN